jgi:hypothetical protein
MSRQHCIVGLFLGLNWHDRSLTKGFLPGGWDSTITPLVEICGIRIKREDFCLAAPKEDMSSVKGSDFLPLASLTVSQLLHYAVSRFRAVLRCSLLTAT